MEDPESLSTDALLEELGGCGLFQIILILIFNLLIIPMNFEYNVDTFGLYNPGWRCLDNVTDDGTYMTSSTALDVTNISTSLVSSTENTTKSDISKYGLHTCDLYQSCQRVEFSPDASTYVTKWGLACDSGWILSTILSIRMAGSMFSTFIVGYIGDRYGRKQPLIFAVIMQFLVLNLISVYSVSWQMYAVIEFFIGCMVSFSILSDILGFEYVPPNWRVKVISIPTRSIVSVLFAVTAMLIHDWQYLRYIVVGLGAVAIIPLFWIPKSIRWLAVKENGKEFQQVMERIAKINRKEIPKRFTSQGDVPYSLPKKSAGMKDKEEKTKEDVHRINARNAEQQTQLRNAKKESNNMDEKETIFTIDTSHYKEKNEIEQNTIDDGVKVAAKSYTLLSLFLRKNYTIATLVVGFISLSFTTLYFALTLGVVSLPGDVYVNMMLSSAIELPAYVIPFFVSNYFKRKPSTFTVFLLVCFCLVGIVVINLTSSPGEDEYDIGIVALVMAAKLFLNIGYIVFITSVGEMYPTVVRATIKSYTTFCSSLGSVIAPFLIPTDPETFYISYLSMAILFFLVSASVLCLPETKDKPMLDDWADDENKSSQQNEAFY